MDGTAQGGNPNPLGFAEYQRCRAGHDQQAELNQLLEVKVDSELREHQKQLRELMKWYKTLDTQPGKIEEFRRRAIELFVSPGLAVIDRGMLKELFSVSPFTESPRLSQDDYERHVINFINNKCLVALAELLTIPKLFMLVCELFLNFFYGKSNVRMAIAAINGGAHLGAAVGAAVPLVNTSVEGAGAALNIMFHLIQFVNDPAKFMIEMEGGSVQGLFDLIPGSDSAKAACLYVFNTVREIGAAALTTAILVNIVSEAILWSFEYVSVLPAPPAGAQHAAAQPAGAQHAAAQPAGAQHAAAQHAAAQPAAAQHAAAQPAAAPNGLVRLVWGGGRWMLNGVGGSIAYIRRHIARICNPSVARLGPPANAYERRLFTCILNNLTRMSAAFNDQAEVAFGQEEANRIRATEVFNALVPSNYRRALKEGNVDAAYTESLLFLATLKDPVFQLCSQQPDIDDDTLRIIAPWVLGVREVTESRLKAFVAQLPLPHHEAVDLDDSMKGEASQEEVGVRDEKIQADFEKWLSINHPLTPEERAKKIKAGMTFFGAPAAFTAMVVRAAQGFYDNYLAQPCGTMFREFSSTLDPGVSHNAVCRLGPLHPNKVIMSGVEHIVQKQISGKELTKDEAILLNSYLNLWSGDPNMLSYGKRRYRDGRTEYCWFVYLGTTCYVLVDGQIERAHPNEVFDDSMFGRAVRIVGDLADSCSAAAADSVMSGASAVANTGLSLYRAAKDSLAYSLASGAAADDNTFMLAGPGGEFTAVQLTSVPLAAALPVSDLHDAAVDAVVAVAVRDAKQGLAAAAARGGDEEDAAAAAAERKRQEDAAAAAAERKRQEDAVRRGALADLNDHSLDRTNSAGKKSRFTGPPDSQGGKSRRKSRKNSKKTTRRNKGRKSSKTAKKCQQQRARNSIRRRRSSRKLRK
jgi:hypothetical protein